jgi:ParB/RepB/Spo0J family partition protein
MQFREHPGVMGKRDAYPFDPRLLKIEPGYNVRNLDSTDDADLELKESIRANGVRVPLEVRLVDEDVFVVAGHRRYKMTMELIAEGEEIKSIPVMPEPKHTTEIDRIINLVISNSGKPLKPLEVAEVVRRLVVFGWDHHAIAKRLGWKSSGSVKQHLDLIAMPEPVKQIVRDDGASATTAAKAMKDAKNDPEFAAQLLRDAAEEQKRLGKKGRATPKSVTAAGERAKPKPLAEPKPTPQPEAPAPLASGLPATTETERSPVTGVKTYAQLQDEIAKIAGTTTVPIEATAPCIVIGVDTASELDRHIETAFVSYPRPISQVEHLLLGFMNADAANLAGQYAQLVKEFEEARSYAQHTDAQEQLCVAADAIGSLRFPEDWENAKATTELAQVA